MLLSFLLFSDKLKTMRLYCVAHSHSHPRLYSSAGVFLITITRFVKLNLRGRNVFDESNKNNVNNHVSEQIDNKVAGILLSRRIFV